MKPLAAWLARQSDGKYMLTDLDHPPVWKEIGKTGKMDFYVEPGDAVGHRFMCPAVSQRIFGFELQIGEIAEVWVTGGRKGS